MGKICAQKRGTVMNEINKIKKEQNNYQLTMSVEEMKQIVSDNDKKTGMKPLSLEEINQYISEVRDGNK